MAADPIVKESLLSGIAQALFQTGHHDEARKAVFPLTDDWLKVRCIRILRDSLLEPDGLRMPL
jgi:hypothetical protein